MATTAQKILKWFTTETGQKFTFGVTVTAGIGLCAAYTLPHTFFLYKFKEVVQQYESGIPVDLTQQVLNRFERTVELLKLPSIEKQNLTPFAVFGFDIFSAGSLQSRYGGIVGIPINFTYIDIEKIDTSNIMVNNESVNWSSHEGQMLYNSFLLSEKAQIYAMAREIKYISSFKVLLDTLYASSTFIGMYTLGSHLNNKYNLLVKPPIIRMPMYGLIATFGYGLYALLTDFTQNRYDLNVDKELCEIDPLFIEGGKEFYDRILMRNAALRKLLGKHGESQYSVLGNENYFLRQKRLPLITRRELFIEKFVN